MQDAKRRQVAVYANYSLHYVGGAPKGEMSADYFGEFARIMPSRVRGDENFVAMMSNGTSGDINNIPFGVVRPPRAPFEQIRIVAQKAADTAWFAHRKIASHRADVRLGMKQREITLTYRRPTEEQVAEAKAVIAVKDPAAIAKLPRLAQIKRQQFSTPPSIAWLCAYLAQPTHDDTFLEPSAGTGLLAAFTATAVASLRLNELDPPRMALLQHTFPTTDVSCFDAAKLTSFLPPSYRPSLIVMNPPFSVATTGAEDKTTAARHLRSALQVLNPGGRLVAIMPDWFSPQSAARVVRRGARHAPGENHLVAGKNRLAHAELHAPEPPPRAGPVGDVALEPCGVVGRVDEDVPDAVAADREFAVVVHRAPVAARERAQHHRGRGDLVRQRRQLVALPDLLQRQYPELADAHAAGLR